jgi:hypothetical protein
LYGIWRSTARRNRPDARVIHGTLGQIR